jgi:hypothetical protein
LTYKDGRIYAGDWLNNKKHGIGLYKMNELGLTYEGNFKDGQMDGIGKLTW